MRLAVMLACFLALSLTASAAERDRSLIAGGLTRTYTLIAPDKITTLLPLLIVYHGGGQTAKRARRNTRFDERAVERELRRRLSARPRQQLERRPRLRPICASAPPPMPTTSSSRPQIIAALEIEGIIDPARVFLTGASNGGMMALRAACELDGRIAGIAPVVANLPVDWQCRAKRMPALFIHGTDDDYMPFAGGQVAATKTKRDLGRC